MYINQLIKNWPSIYNNYFSTQKKKVFNYTKILKYDFEETKIVGLSNMKQK
jgi:hypothetical protein